MESRKNPWSYVAVSAVGIIWILAIAGTGYWIHANRIPVYTPAIPVLPSPNAYDVYSEAAALLPVEVRRVDPRRNLSPEELRRFVERSRPALRRMRSGFRHECRAAPILSFDQPLPELPGFRSLGRALIAEGRLAEAEGRPAEAARSYLDCLRLGADVPRGGPLVHTAVGIFIQMLALEELQRVTERLDARTARSTAREMARLRGSLVPPGEALTTDRELHTVATIALMRNPTSWGQIQASNPTGPGHPLRDLRRRLQYSFTPKARILADHHQYIDAAISRSQKPYYQRGPDPQRPSDPLSQLVLPEYTQAEYRWAFRDAHWGITELRLAARAHLLERGALPAEARSLVPEYLPRMPDDPFAPEPLVFRRSGDELLVYSRGPDGDDDGGDDLGRNAFPAANGDLVTLRKLPPRR